MTIIELDIIHKNLRKYRYFYYNCDDIVKMELNIVSDYEYDVLEKRYSLICDELNILQELRVTNFVGFDIGIPMSLLNFYK